MPILAFLFVLSGAAGLIYESVWARYISLLVGHSAYAQVIVLVIFLGGMALGSFAVGRWSERIRSPLLWYAAAEVIIGLFAIAFHGVFVGTTRLAYEQWLPSLSPGLALTAATWSIAALLILPQSILLGATFPLMTAGAMRLRPGRDGFSLGLLYFANSFGAALGVLAEGFVLVGAFGLEGTLRTAALLNVIVGVAIVVFFGRTSPATVPATAPAPAAAPAAGLSRLQATLLAVSFATAFSSFLYEIAWTRMLSLVHGSATHSFELMLSAFILGLALGSLWISRRIDGLRDPVATLAALQWAMGIAAIATLPLYIWSYDWTAMLLTKLPATDTGYQWFSAGRYGMALIIMLPATFCAGTTLPLITRTLMVSGSGERAIGAVYGVNTIGSIVGAAVAALVLVPLIGLKWVLLTGGLIDVAVAGALFWSIRARGDAIQIGSRLRIAAIGSAVAVLAMVIFAPFTPARMASGVYRYAAVLPPDLYRYFFYRDGRTASVSVRQETRDTTGLFTISTNGKPDASVSPRWIQPYDPTADKMLLDQDMTTQMLLPLLTLAHVPPGKIGAVIGQGSGITSHMLLGSTSVERLYTIEIEPEMINGSRLFYPGNKRVFDDPRSAFVTDDARAFLSATGPRFDFVVSEPSNPWVSGVSSLFTVEFYSRVRQRLQPTGVFVQWFHLYEIDDQAVSSVLATIDRVFPSYRIYMCSNADIIIVAGPGPRMPTPDWNVVSIPEIAADLRRFPPLEAETFEAAEIGGHVTLRPYLARAPVNSDFHPLLDLNGERLRFRKDFANQFRELFEMRLDVPAAIEQRRRDFGTVPVNPTAEIHRTAVRTRGMHLRAARRDRNTILTWSDDSLRSTATRLSQFDQRLADGIAPADWGEWVARFVDAENELHDGTAGVADEDFYGDVRRYLAAARAPVPVHMVVAFYHGLAAWDWAETVRAGDFLLAESRTERTWVWQVMMRRGTALAKLQTGDAAGAKALYAEEPRDGWKVTDLVLMALIDRKLGASPAKD